MAGLVALAAQAAAFRDVFLDDAYITFRYGQNLATGAGLVFNPGERVLGTTSPGQALLVAAAYRIVGRDALPVTMSIVGCAAWTAQALLLYVLARKLGRFQAAVVALGVAVGAARSHLFVPLETNLVAACCLGAVLLAERARPVATGLLFGLACLLRADSALLAIPLALLLAARSNRFAPARAALAALVAVGPWVGFATAYFGSPVPRTLQAKAFHDSLATYAAHIAEQLPAMALPFTPPAAAAVIAWLVAAWGARMAFTRRAWGVCAIVGWGVLHALAYLVLRPGTGFTWHLYPSVIAFVVSILVAMGDALARIPRLAALPLAAGVVACASLGAVKFAQTHAHVFWYGSRDAVYREAASWLQANAKPGDVTEAEEVGTMAYWSGLSFYDHAGLVGPPFDHGRLALGTAPEVRFSVMTQAAEVQAHLPFFGRVPPMKELAYDRWHLWIADLKASP
jgi:hypothetical protein